MKLESYFRILFAGVLLVLLSACANMPGAGPGALVGTWTNSLGTRWTLNPDGTFQVARYHRAKPDIWGNYTVSGDTLTIKEVRGKAPKACKQPATYKFHRMGDELRLTMVSDTCGERIKNVTQPWHRT